MNMRTWLLCSAMSIVLSACGGGGDLINASAPASSEMPGSRELAPGKYKLTFTAISTARLPVAVSGVEVAVKLPTGLSVATVPGSGASGPFNAASVMSGSAVQAGGVVFGGYSSSTRTAYVTMVTTQENFRGGTYVSLLFTAEPGSAVTPDDIYNMNAVYPHYRVVGVDTAAHSTVLMTGMVRTRLAVEQ